MLKPSERRRYPDASLFNHRGQMNEGSGGAKRHARYQPTTTVGVITQNVTAHDRNTREVCEM